MHYIKVQHSLNIFAGACFSDATAHNAAATGDVTSGIVAVVTVVAVRAVVATAAVVVGVRVVVGTGITIVFCFEFCNYSAKTRAKRATNYLLKYRFPRVY